MVFTSCGAGNLILRTLKSERVAIDNAQWVFYSDSVKRRTYLPTAIEQPSAAPLGFSHPNQS